MSRRFVGYLVNVLSTDRKGAIAELAIARSALELGVDVYRPMAEGGRYDLIFDIVGQLVRVQCKWAPLYREVIVLRCYSSRRGFDGLRRRPYQPGELDAYAAYCPDTDRCYFVPLETFAGRVQVVLRLSPTKNHQRERINWAENYEFAARLGRSGAVAQLGERDAGSVEVTGSSPVGSTL